MNLCMCVVPYHRVIKVEPNKSETFAVTFYSHIRGKAVFGLYLTLNENIFGADGWKAEMEQMFEGIWAYNQIANITCVACKLIKIIIIYDPKKK